MVTSNQEKKFVKNMLYMLSAPTIVAPGYEDQITPDLKNKAQLYRLAGIENIEKEMATDYDAMLYLMTASFIQPFNSSWKKIYLNCFLKYNDVALLDTDPEKQKWFLKDAELDENELLELHRMQRWIFKRQMEHLK